MKTRAAVLALLLLGGCVNASPLELDTFTRPGPEATVYATTRGDSLRLVADRTFRAKMAGTGPWLVGRWWTEENGLGATFCARPNAITDTQSVVACSGWIDRAGQLHDPGSIFFHDGAVRTWEPVAG